MKEKRQFPRFYLDILVNYSTNAKTRSKDISQEGICIITKKAFKKDSYLNLVFTLPEDTKEIKAYGKVVWSKMKKSNLYENGIKFWHISNFDKEKIKKYINNQLNV